MGEVTGIAWTHHTFNPWWGCTKVSEACRSCYAEELADRFPKTRGLWGPGAPRKIASEKTWAEPLKWDRKAREAGERRRVFCASMADVFEDRRDLDAPRSRLWALISETPWLDWLLLTKRPQHVRELAPLNWLGTPGIDADWPLNVWLGTTVENQATAEERIPHLARVPAAVRFLSCEPLLGHLDLTQWLGDWEKKSDVSWVIVGGESGAGARPMALEWARSLVDQCVNAQVPVFVKQLGSRPTVDYYDRAAREAYEEVGAEWPAPIGWHPSDGQPGPGSRVAFECSDRKGGNPSDWPADLRVQAFPVSA